MVEKKCKNLLTTDCFPILFFQERNDDRKKASLRLHPGHEVTSYAYFVQWQLGEFNGTPQGIKKEIFWWTDEFSLIFAVYNSRL